MRASRLFLSCSLVASLWLTFGATYADVPERLLLASTTSTENSGLLAEILPMFEQEYELAVHVVAVGTGAALDLGRRCDADLLLVHAPRAEAAYMRAGYGVDRRPVMFNDFVLVGPQNDPAHIQGLSDVALALQRIAAAQAPFLSRGDESGTHKKERQLWRDARTRPEKADGNWYRETGSGMGATLNTARAMQGYALTDRGTWISFNNREDMALLVEGDARLFNPYHVLRVNPARCPGTQSKGAAVLSDWLTGPEGQAAIAAFRLRGQQLFHPDADTQPPGSDSELRR